MAVGCDADSATHDVTRVLSGGEGTVFDASPLAFSLPLATLTAAEREDFVVGNNFFSDSWVIAPSSTSARDGLGPTFNARACATCHFRDGRGRTPSPGEPLATSLVRVSVVDALGRASAHPLYGDQLQTRAIPGVPAEASVTIATEERPGAYGDGTPYTLVAVHVVVTDLAFGPLGDEARLSLRVAPAVFGLGLLEAVPEDTLRALADPDDRDGDGVSGRAVEVDDLASGHRALGRFGWKAGQPTVRQQSAAAFLGDMGITSSVFPEENCPPIQRACLEAYRTRDPDASDEVLTAITAYGRTLAVPARRDVDDPWVRRGERLFSDLGCAACHMPTLRTGPARPMALAYQVIHPYTDLLVHDMGDELADHRPEGGATGREWRTPPLWGLGLVRTVSGHEQLLHDGRARGAAEAILWHGGEATSAREAFRNASAADRAALLRFLSSL
jgi:CxxC motif-containing protein (DUF1111 family)